MDLTKLVVTGEQLSGDKDVKGIVTDISDGYEYKDGKRTDRITHKVVEAVFPGNKYDKQRVKVLDLKIPITAEQLIEQGEKKVKFKNLRGKIYRTGNGDYAISATADSLEVII